MTSWEIILLVLGAISGIVIIAKFWSRKIFPGIKNSLQLIGSKTFARNSNTAIETLTRHIDLSIRMCYTGIMLDKIPADVFAESLKRKFVDLHHHIEQCRSLKSKNVEISFGQWYTGCLISYAAEKKIEFNQLAAIIIAAIGLDLAKEVVVMHNILEHYGPECSAKWKTLLEE